MCRILVYFITGIDLEGMHECVSGVMRKFLLLSAGEDGVFAAETVGLAMQGALISRHDPVRMAGGPDFPT